MNDSLPPAVVADANVVLSALIGGRARLVDWQPREVYEPYREEAERRIAVRDPEDWPTVALALTRSLPIWSQDKDMEAADVKVYTTGELRDAIRDAGGESA